MTRARTERRTHVGKAERDTKNETNGGRVSASSAPDEVRGQREGEDCVERLKSDRTPSVLDGRRKEEGRVSRVSF